MSASHKKQKSRVQWLKIFPYTKRADTDNSEIEWI